MKKKLLLLGISLGTAVCGFGGYVPLTVTSGFNADVVADGVGTATATTTDDIDGVNYCYVANGWQLNASSTPITTGLPATGLFTTQVTATSGLTFQLAPYSGMNDLRLPGNTSGTLTFQTALPAQNVYVLAVTGSGSSVMTVKLNFSDGTSQTSSNIAVDDWYGGTSVALSGFDRLNMTLNTLDGGFNGPNLYQYEIAVLPANQTKPIASIEVTRISASGLDATLNVMAVSIEESLVVTCPAPTNLTASAITTSGADLGWTEAGSATQWEVTYGTAGFSLGSGIATTVTTSNPYSVSGLSMSTAYDFYVRAICGPGDTSAWTGPFSFTTNCTAPNLLTTTPGSRCGDGTVTLSATADPGATIKWYDVSSGGTALGTGATFTTPSLTTTTTYYAAAATGAGAAACESPRDPVVATVNELPVVDLGADTTICPGVTLTLGAAQPGASYAWNTGATSATIDVTTAGDYSLTVTSAEGCSAADTITLNAGTAPVNNLAASYDLCEGEVMDLDAGNAGADFDWSTGATTQIISVTTGGAYSVTITNSDHCVLTASTDVISRTNPVVTLREDTAVCAYDPVLLDAGNAGSTFAWNTGAATQTISTTDSGDYSVVVTNTYGCIGSDTFHLAFLDLPYTGGFNFIPSFDVFGEVAFSMLDTSDVQEASWDFGDGTPPVSDFEPVHQYAVSGDYLVVLTVTNGCGTYSTSQWISVNKTTGIVTRINADNQLLVFPNPATGFVSVKTNSGAPIDAVLIYSMDGKVVFRTDTTQPLHRINVANWSSGVYLIRTLSDGRWQTGRLEVLQ